MKVALLFFLTCVIRYSAATSDTLRLVHVFFRHGSRTPEEKDIYPNDPHTYESFLPMGYGQLTNEGIEMAYKLGKNLRRKYNSFLGDIYSPELVEATSTDFDRTKMSVLAALAGLFPPAESQTWHENMKWMPIPYQYEKGNNDFVLRRPINYCPAFVRELDRVLDSVHGRNVIEEYKDVFETISEHAGKRYRTLSNAFGLWQTLTAEKFMNRTLPEWTNSVFPEKLTYLSEMQCEFENYNQILKRLNGGRSLSMVVRNMRGKIQDTLEPKGRKIFIYSGHENNVINVLAAMNLYKRHIPTYSSAVYLELHYLPDQEVHAVKVYYAKDVNREAIPLMLDGCQELCPFEDFLKIVKPHIPVNYTSECEAPQNLGDF